MPQLALADDVVACVGDLRSQAHHHARDEARVLAAEVRHLRANVRCSVHLACDVHLSVCDEALATWRLRRGVCDVTFATWRLQRGVNGVLCGMAHKVRAAADEARTVTTGIRAARS
jgi:hypothetical protein